MKKIFPLVTRDLNAPIAYITKPMKQLEIGLGVIDTRTFLSHVSIIAARLKEGSYAINLCENRYLFLVCFCAVILRKQTNLLPPNKNIVTQKQLSDSYVDTYIIHDGADVLDAIEHIDVSGMRLDMARCLLAETDQAIPHIEDEHLACISFTSGSTGGPTPNYKYWNTLYLSTSINYRHMVPTTNELLYQLATVPPQHMWGLETSILMPLFQNVCVSADRPLFPKDIVDSLHMLPSPRMLVSTPVHLRVLSQYSHSLSLHVVLCATSPLTIQLAQEIEAQFASPLLEVYGCSEVGSMAVKRTSQEKYWYRFDDILFNQNGADTLVTADHLPATVMLQDRIELINHQQFRLLGRSSDLVKIAGKRGSLLEINQTLLSFDGVEDGIIFYPESNNVVTRLCAIVAMKDGFDKKMLRSFLRKYLDTAFIPRPIYVVNSIPRESNGKLLRGKLTALYQDLKS